MSRNRSLLSHGLLLTVRRLPAVLWAFLFNFCFSALFLLHTHTQLAGILDKSLASGPLHNGFDLPTTLGSLVKIGEGSPGGTSSNYIGIPAYLLIYFLLVPGTLLCYQTGAPARLSTLLQAGMQHFWRFVRITLLTLIIMALILGPLALLYSKWADHVEQNAVGRNAVLQDLAGILILALVAAIFRLYFDLVEVYTVQLGLQLRPNGKPDRRVRKTLLPAFRALRFHFGLAYLSFLLLAILGYATVFLTARISMHSLAQPRLWPMFLLGQIGLFLLLFARFWQRGAETTLSLNYPIFEAPVVRTTFAPRDSVPSTPYPAPAPHVHLVDPIPDPEPGTPSLGGPDPGIYHREVTTVLPHKPLNSTDL